MKKIIAILAIFAASSTMASISMFVDYTCKATDLVYMNKFEMKGEIDLFAPEGNFKNNVASIVLTKAGYDTTQEFAEVKLTGKLKYFFPNELAKNEIYQIQAVQKGEFIEYASLVLGHPDKFSSVIRTSDGTEYKAKCNFSF